MIMKMVLKQLLSLVLPFTVLVVIPYLIISDRALPIMKSADYVTVLAFIIGAPLVVMGLAGMALTIKMFIQIGKGTLAPWSPTKKLVVKGLYAHVRNPMISSVLLVLLGEAFMFESWKLLVWWAVVLAVNHAYFILVEEPGLYRRFGEEYRIYKDNVPRWIPRISPWEPGE